MQNQTQSEQAVRRVFSKKLYTREAIFAAAELFLDRCQVSIMPKGETEVEVQLTSRKLLADDLERLVGLLGNEVHDQQVRLDLETRNGHLRDIILRHAFEPIKNLETAVKTR